LSIRESSSKEFSSFLILSVAKANLDRLNWSFFVVFIMSNESREAMLVKFIVDENLAKLCRWLRFLGYDTVLLKDVKFHVIERIAIKERRIILTRKRKCKLSSSDYHLQIVYSESLSDQIKELRHYLQIDHSKLLSRCSKCNEKLYKIDKDKVKHMLDEYLLDSNEVIRYCRSCGRFYWQGSHYQRIIRTLSSILE